MPTLEQYLTQIEEATRKSQASGFSTCVEAPDGSEVSAYLHGYQRLHFRVDRDGENLLRGTRRFDGVFERIA